MMKTRNSTGTPSLGATLGALKNMSPNPAPRRQMYRSNSFTSRTEASRKSRDENSVMFHDDNTIFSNYDYSLAGSVLTGRSRASTTSRGLGDLLGGLKPMNTDDLHDSFSLYTSNTPVPTEEELLEEAIRKGAALASQEDQDTVVSMKDFSRYRSSLASKNKKEEPASNFQLEMEPETPNDRWSSGGAMQPPREEPPAVAPAAVVDPRDLKERKMHRHQSRRALAERKAATSDDHSDSHNNLEHAHTDHRPTVMKRSSTGTANSKLSANNNSTSKRGMMSKCTSQPSLMSATQSISTWDPESSIPTITAGSIPLETPNKQTTTTTRGRAHTRPPVTKTHRASASITSGQDTASINDESSIASSIRGRSRSIGRKLRSAARSLSRLGQRFKGTASGDTSEDDNDKAVSKRKKECTCPADDVMLTSCPRHGEKAAKILAKRKAKEEKKEQARIKKEQAKKAKEEKKLKSASTSKLSPSTTILTSSSSRMGRSRKERGRSSRGLGSSLTSNTTNHDTGSMLLCSHSHSTHDGLNHVRRHTAAEC